VTLTLEGVTVTLAAPHVAAIKELMHAVGISLDDAAGGARSPTPLCRRPTAFDCRRARQHPAGASSATERVELVALRAGATKTYRITTKMQRDLTARGRNRHRHSH
jgi:hypothetical protein